MTSQFWNLEEVTHQLRRARTDWRSRFRDADVSAHRLPSVIAVEHIVEGFLAAIYPQRLGNFGGKGLEEDLYVKGGLRNALSALLHQLNFEPALSAPAEGGNPPDTTFILRKLAASLPAIRRLTDSDIEAANSPDLGSVDEILLCDPSLIAILRYRLAHQAFVLGAPLIARIMARSAYSLTGIYIHPGATIGPHFAIKHGSGTVIGAMTSIGSHVRVHQGVTLGDLLLTDTRSDPDAPPRPGPTLEDQVEIHAGATVSAGLRIGRGATIGSNVNVTDDVAPHSKVL